MKAKERRATGSIDRRGDRWRVRLRLPNGARPALYTAPGAEYSAAEALLEASLRELAGTDHDPRSGAIALGAWGERWLDAREQTHRDAGGDRQRWAQHIAGSSIAAVRLDVIGPTHVRTWLDSMGRRELARQTVRNVYTTLRACLRSAQRAHAITALRLKEILAEPMPEMRHERTVELDERIAYLTDAQIGAVLALELTPEQLTAFVVGVWTGMRAGELHGLSWERVRIDDVRPHVVVARSRGGATKSGKVARVPLLEPARAALHRRWVERGRPTSGLVWPADDGSPHRRGYDWGWSDHRERRDGAVHVRPGIATRAGIEGVAWKDATRHTCGVHLLRGTWAPDFVPAAYRLEEVSRFLRHSSLAVTERHYAHLSLDALPTVPAVDLEPRPPLGPELGPVGPEGGAGASGSFDLVPVFQASSESHTRDLNTRPTVYETRVRPNDPARIDPTGTQAGPTAMAVQVMRALALRDGEGLAAAALALATAVLSGEGRARDRETSSVGLVRLRLVRP